MKAAAIDIETYSNVDLAKSGVYRYCESPDFEILLFSYSVDGGEVKVVDLASGESLPRDILEALTDDNVVKWAFNANFERVCLSRYLSDRGISLDPFADSRHSADIPGLARYLNPESWRCCMVWSAYMGMPLSLKNVGAVLGLEKQKLTGGRELIRYFCSPCKPTAANGQRTRNLPGHAPDKWESFKAYARRDVETEMSIRERLAKFPVPDEVWEEYILDQEINDRGVALDMALVRSAMKADTRSRSELTRLICEITGLDNPNSVQQMKRWLANNGMETDTLGKKAVAELLKDAPEPLGKALALRQQLAKSSVKKYQAMEHAVCADNLARGMFQFYGANRTGRWAGRLIQIQNLPQNHMPGLGQARELVRGGSFAALELLYDSVPEVLSELIRTAFIPKEGRKLIIADFSSIERVVLAWLAGEQWVLNAYADKQDLYLATASQMFHVPLSSLDKKHPLRQKGKVADLACVAKGEPVLTDNGLVPIECVTMDHRVWDGAGWVAHEGVVYRGKRDVIEYDGLKATADHPVWIEGQSRPVRFGFAAVCGAYLTQSGNGRLPIRVGINHFSRKTMECFGEPLLRNHSFCSRSGKGAEEKRAYRLGKARLYDIRNAGPHHRYTVSGRLVHNCGYGGSAGALKAMGALDMGLSEDELRPLVSAWRSANPNIVRF